MELAGAEGSVAADARVGTGAVEDSRELPGMRLQAGCGGAKSRRRGPA